MRGRSTKAIGALVLLLSVAFVGLFLEALNTTELSDMYQQDTVYSQQLAKSTFQQLPEYVVSGAMGAPAPKAQYPPQGVVMQFPGSQSAESEDEEDEAQDEELTAEEKAAKKEQKKQDDLFREMKRSRERSYKVSEEMFQLKRFLKFKAKEIVEKVKDQTGKLLRSISEIPGTVGAMGPRGTPGTPGTNGENGAHGEPGPAGPQGDPGEAGIEGDVGPPGPDGVVGPIGPQGPDGPAGKKGTKGSVGPIGSEGGS